MQPGLPVGLHRTRPDVSDWRAASAALSLLEGKWVVTVLAELATGARRRNALRRAIGSGMPDKALTDTLKRILADELVTRRVLDDEQRAVVYSLTPLGHALLEILAALIEWSHRNRPTLPTAPGRDA